MISRLSDDDAIELVRTAMAVEAHALEHDVWPRVRRRIGEGAAAPPVAFDCLLAVAAALLCVLQPAAVGLLLLHF